MKLIAQIILVIVIVVLLGPGFIALLGGLWLLLYLADWHK